jgi:hypothetical protein
MKHLWIFLLVAPLAAAQTTPNINLNIPAHGTLVNTWDAPINANFTALDSYLGGVSALPNGFKVTGAITAGGFIGPLTGTATGLTGTPDIVVGALTGSDTDTLLPLGTASVSQNFNSNMRTLTASYWNGTAAVNATLQQYLWLGTGTNPAVLENHYFPAGLNTNTVNFAINEANLATSGANIDTPKLKLRGACWNGSSSTLSDWSAQGNQASGTNTGNTLTFTYSGCGTGIVSVPQIKTTAGVPGIQLTAAAFSTYPACAAGTEGLEEAVTDSTTNTWGATVMGGASFHIKMYCDGSAWTVEAK